MRITSCQGHDVIQARIACGSAVPSTSAPTMILRAPPRPPRYQPEAIFMPTG